jgi:hypothetical protein
VKISSSDISVEDFQRYFQGSYITDPHTKKPARLHTVQSGLGEGMILHVENYHPMNGDYSNVRSSIVSYYGEDKLAPFYDFNLYTKGSFGYRNTYSGKLLVYISFLPFSISGHREENNLLLFPDFSTDTFVSSHATLASAVAITQQCDAKEAINEMLSGSVGSVVINPELALTFSLMADCDEFPIEILYRQTRAGKISINGEAVIVKEAQDVLGEVFA